MVITRLESTELNSDWHCCGVKLSNPMTGSLRQFQKITSQALQVGKTLKTQLNRPTPPWEILRSIVHRTGASFEPASFDCLAALMARISSRISFILVILSSGSPQAEVSRETL